MTKSRMHPRLRQERLRRQHARASHRYRLRHPTHRGKTGHNFRWDPRNCKKCFVCGKDR